MLEAESVFGMASTSQDFYNGPIYTTPQHGETQTPITSVLGPISHQPACKIDIVEEPKEIYRFRYISDTHIDAILGRTHTKENKTFPAIKTQNVPQYVKSVVVRVGIYWDAVPEHHHAHQIMWKQSKNEKRKVGNNFIEFCTSQEQDYTINFNGLGIIRTKEKDFNRTLFDKIKTVKLVEKGAQTNDPHPELTHTEELQLKSNTALLESRLMEKQKKKQKSAVLGFQAFDVNHGVYKPICPLAFSCPMKNIKDPKICRISSSSGSVFGGDDIMMFIDKVTKGDIKVRFFELRGETRVWEEFAELQEVHLQCGIAFKTPQYLNVNVDHDVGAFIELYRPSDEATSDSKEFTFKSSENSRLRNKACWWMPTHPLLLNTASQIEAPEENQNVDNDEDQISSNPQPISDNAWQNDVMMDILNEPLLDDPVPIVPEFDMTMLGNIVSDSCTSRTAMTSSSNSMHIPKQIKGETNAVLESISSSTQAFTSGIRTDNIKEKVTEKASTDPITRNSFSEKQTSKEMKETNNKINVFKEKIHDEESEEGKAGKIKDIAEDMCNLNIYSEKSNKKRQGFFFKNVQTILKQTLHHSG